VIIARPLLFRRDEWQTRR